MWNEQKKWVEPTATQYTFLNGSLLWSKGTVFKGKRLLSTFDKSVELDEMVFNCDHQHPFYIELNKAYHDFRLYEEDFFVYALHRAIFFLYKAADHYTGFRKIAEEIEAVIGEGNAKDVRDMRVHIDEYVKGKRGKSKDNARFLYESPDDLFYFCEETD